MKEETRDIRKLLRQQLDVLAEACKSANAIGVAEATKAMLEVAAYLESPAEHS